jgi:two-component system NarL family response regulator
MNLGCSRRLDVMVMHPDPIVCAGLVAALGRQADFRMLVHGSDDAGPGDAPIDVVIADYLTAMSLVDPAARRADPRLSHAGILALTAHDGEADIRRAIQAGVRGYLLLGASLDELADGVRALGNGSRFLCPMVAQRMADSLARGTLTVRESDVLRLVATGRSNKEIARLLGIELGTVKSHVSAIMGKLGAMSRTQAASIAATRGLVPDIGASRAPRFAPRSHTSEAISHLPEADRMPPAIETFPRSIAACTSSA